MSYCRGPPMTTNAGGIVAGAVLGLILLVAALATAGIAVVALGFGFVAGGATYIALGAVERLAIGLIDDDQADIEVDVMPAPLGLLEEKQL